MGVDSELHVVVDGREVAVRGLSPQRTVAEFAALVRPGSAPCGVPLVDGRAVAAADPLAAAGVRRGANVRLAAPDEIPVPVAVAVWRTGPLAGLVEPLGAGPTLVGRATARPWLVSWSDGRTHAHPVVQPVAGGHGPPPFEVVGPGRAAPVATGAGPAAVPGRAPWTVTFQRGPAAAPAPVPGPIEPPAAGATVEAGTRPGVLLPLAASVAGSVAVAVLMGRPEWLLLGLVGMLGTVAARLQQRRADRRDAAAARRRQAEAEGAFAVAVAAAHAGALAAARARPDLADALAWAVAGRGGWTGRAGAEVALGRGDEPWVPPLARPLPAPTDTMPSSLEDVPVVVALRPGVVLGLVGPRPAARALARAVVAQAAAQVGPSDLTVTAMSSASWSPWSWVAWLPHACGPDDGRPLVAAGDVAVDRLVASAAPVGDPPERDGAGRWLLAVVDDATLLAPATAASRALVAQRRRPCAAVVLAGTEAELPAGCTDVLAVAPSGRTARWVRRHGAPASGEEVRLAGLHRAAATGAARALAGFDDPDAPADRALPDHVRLVDLVGDDALDGASLAAAWSALGADPPPRAPVAVAVDGVVELDLERDGPHALVAGTTGSGKSELLRTLVVALAVRNRPQDLAFVLVDYKGGAAFDACAALPHVVGVVTDLDDALAARALVSLEAEVRRRERLLRAAGVSDLSAYRRSPAASEPLARLVVVVDEFAALAADLPTFLTSLVDVARRGRSLGVHLVLATQRPAGAVNDDIRANTDLRVALRVQDGADARDVVGDPSAAALPRDRPGRFVARLGPGELVVAQAAWCTAPLASAHEPSVAPLVLGRVRLAGGGHPARGDASELEAVVAAVRDAHRRSGAPAPPRPWLPPLPGPAGLVAAGLPAGAVGLLDDPAAQRQPVLRPPDEGNLALVGSAARGADAALAALALTLADEGHHVYVLATGGPCTAALAGHASVGAVVRLTETERVARLVHRLSAAVSACRDADGAAGAADRPPVVLVVEGLPAVRAALDEPATHGVLDALDALVAEGAEAGLRVVATLDRPGAVPLRVLASFAHRWVFPASDGGDAPLTVGGAPPSPTAPPGRVVVQPGGLTAQLVQPGPDEVAARAARARRSPGAPPPAPIGVLPVCVPAHALPAACSGPGRWTVVVGVADADLAPVALELHDGDHLVVAGPARSGRTAALRLLAAAHGAARPCGPTPVYVAGRRAAAPPEGPWAATTPDALAATLAAGAPPPLVLVDDAELVDDLHGAIARLLDAGRTTVVAAGRPDALRSLYGHWTQRVRRDRRGIVLQPTAELDGDVLGLTLPRRPLAPLAPGRGYLVRDGRAELVQLAWCDP